MSTLADIMSSPVRTVSPDALVSEATQAMVEGGFGSVVVLEGSWIVGIFTERDALRSTAAGADPSSTRVSEWMTRDPDTASPDMDVEKATELMIGRGFRHLPVVEGQRKLSGVVSLRDLLSVRIGRRP